MKISGLIFLSIFSILLLFSTTTYVNYKQSEEVRENAEFLSASSNIVKLSNQFQRNVLYMDGILKGYVFTNEKYLMPTYDSAYAENNVLLAELTSSIPKYSVQYMKLDKITSMYKEWLRYFAGPIVLASKNEESSQSPALLKFRQIFQSEEKINKYLQQEFRELLNEEYKIRAARKTLLARSEEKTKLISIILTGLSIIIGFVIAILLEKYITKRILKMVKMANSIAKGDYKVQVQDKSNDELTALTRSLNHMAKMLEQNISLLQRKNRELDRFAHIVSHDLKAPLRGMDNVLSWIEEDHADEIPEKVTEYLNLIKGRINRSENLIQGLLTYARVGRESNEKEKVDINLLIKEIVENLAVKAGLQVAVQEKLPVIYTEKLPLMQIFTNLLSNAIKHHNSQNGKVKIYYKENFQTFRFYVEDDGPGIAKAYHNKIFEIFQTLTEKDTFESTGVGLAIVKKILDERDEQIDLVSDTGKGAVFSFTWRKN